MSLILGADPLKVSGKRINKMPDLGGLLGLSRFQPPVEKLVLGIVGQQQDLLQRSLAKIMDDRLCTHFELRVNKVIEIPPCQFVPLRRELPVAGGLTGR